MPLQINIISNVGNGSGLQKDYEILKTELEALGHKVRGVNYLSTFEVQTADLNLWLEVGQPFRLFKLAKLNWLIPNPEWWRPNWDWKQFDLILCKTQDALRIFSGLKSKCVYLGFMSQDRYVKVEKKKVFLHVAGKSPFKNTASILAAWESLSYKLIVVTSLRIGKIPNVEIYNRVSEEKLNDLCSSSMFHLCPSEYEGWGHNIHEGLSAGGIVIGSDSPLMLDFKLPGNLLVKSSFRQKHLLADLYNVTAEGVKDIAHQAMSISDEKAQQISQESRKKFEDECLAFKSNLKTFISEIS